MMLPTIQIFIFIFQDSNRQRVNDLTYQMQVLEDELADAKLQCSKVNANAMAQKSNYEIAVGILITFLVLIRDNFLKRSPLMII